MTPIRVLLAEDHTIVRKGIRLLLDADTDIEVVGEAEDGRAAVEKCESIHPDIVVMDHTMPVLNGLEAMRQILQRLPDVKVLILTMHTSEEYVFQFLQEGAARYLVKQSAPTELVAAIRAVHQGQSFLSPSISRTAFVEPVAREDTVSTSVQSKSSVRVDEQVAVPSDGELCVLYDFAMKGEVRRLAALADEIAGREDAARSFAERLCLLAEEFDEQGILDLLHAAVYQEDRNRLG